jgi:hypothetical protein
MQGAKLASNNSIASRVYSTLLYLFPPLFLIEFLFKYNAITCLGVISSLGSLASS